MGKKIYAQSNSDSEYVKSVYKWVLLSYYHTDTDDNKAISDQ